MLLFVAGFVSSCEDVVQVKLDEGSKLYVIDAFINDLPQEQVIKLSYNDSYFSTTEAPPLSGAVVVVKDLTEGTEYSFNESGAGRYVYTPGPEGFGALDHQYQLNVTVNGDVYTSLSLKKRTAVIRAINDTLVTGGGGFGAPPSEPFYFCSLVAKDTVDAVTDYYWVKTLRNDTLLFSAENIGFSFAIDGTNGPVSDAGADTTNFTPPVTFLGFARFLPGDRCRVQIHSISRETYFFFVQVGQQVNNAGLFATTPENVRTNIVTPEGAATKAVGWFNVATVDEKEIVLP